MPESTASFGPHEIELTAPGRPDLHMLEFHPQWCEPSGECKSRSDMEHSGQHTRWSVASDDAYLMLNLARYDEIPPGQRVQDCAEVMVKLAIRSTAVRAYADVHLAIEDAELLYLHLGRYLEAMRHDSMDLPRCEGDDEREARR